MYGSASTLTRRFFRMVEGQTGVVKERSGPLNLNWFRFQRGAGKQNRRTASAPFSSIVLSRALRMARSLRSHTRRLAENLHAGEEISNLELRGFRRVGTMDGVEFNICSVRFAYGPGIGFRGVGRSHQLAILLDGIVALQHKDDRRSGRHEGAEALEKRASFVYGIKPLRHRLRHVNHLDGDRLQPPLFWRNPYGPYTKTSGKSPCRGRNIQPRIARFPASRNHGRR